jgi:carbonic anhydrase/acetyltransferase-like protein (isoleucine patch superfamily)
LLSGQAVAIHVLRQPHRPALGELAARRLRAERGGHKLRTLTIDVDGLPVEVHGEQPGSAWNGHYHQRMYHPIIACAAETGDMLDARLRPGNALADNTKVGNFVEMKAAIIEDGVKVNHLSYIGDAHVGSGSNIGAGTITCNYDGFGKHKTTIGAGAFVGTNSSLVAPVTIGAGAYIGSGSVITKDVPDNAMAVERSQQTIREGGATRYRELKTKGKGKEGK